MSDSNPRRYKPEQKRFKSSHSRQSLMLSFHRQDHNKNFPSFQKPKILGDFSVDGSRRYCCDRSQLKFFDGKRFKNVSTGKFEKVEWDMNTGMSKVIRKSPDCKKENIDHMLRYEIIWILSNKSLFRQPKSARFDFLPVDFVCFRGLLVALMTTLYENSNDWEVWAIKFRGTIYLCAKETQLKKVRLI